MKLRTNFIATGVFLCAVCFSLSALAGDKCKNVELAIVNSTNENVRLKKTEYKADGKWKKFSGKNLKIKRREEVAGGAGKEIGYLTDTVKKKCGKKTQFRVTFVEVNRHWNPFDNSKRVKVGDQCVVKANGKGSCKVVLTKK